MKRKEKTSSIGFGKRNLTYIVYRRRISKIAKENRWKSQWGYEAFFNSLDGKSCGVINLFNNTFEYVLHNVIIVQELRPEKVRFAQLTAQKRFHSGLL